MRGSNTGDHITANETSLATAVYISVVYLDNSAFLRSNLNVHTLHYKIIMDYTKSAIKLQII